MNNLLLIKTAALESSTMTDPASGRAIRVSSTVRKKYRQYFAGQNGREDLSRAKNSDLNDIIAKDFADSATNAKHMFKAKNSDSSGKNEFIEIRAINRGKRAVAFNMFFAVIRQSSIDIITITQSWLKPTNPRKVVYQ
jgi:hypothetical protein